MYQRILVPFDGSDCARRAFEEAVRLAKEQQARLRIINVLEDMPWQSGMSEIPVAMDALLDTWRAESDKMLAALKQQAREQGVEAETQMVETVSQGPAARIVEDAGKWPADLIVMGTHGRHGIERMFLGSVAEGVARHATVPVLLVHCPHAPG